MRVEGLRQPVDWSDGMDNTSAQQLVRPCNFGVAGFASLVHPALFGKLSSGSRMDGAADATTSHERLVRGIDDGAIREVKLGDICAYEAYFSIDDGVGGEDGSRVRGELVGVVEERESGDFGFVDCEGHVQGRNLGVLADQGLEPGH